MLDGKKTVAEGIVYGALEILEQKIPDADGDGGKLLSKAIDNVRPRLEVKARRVGGATYQVPIEVPVSRGNALAMRWVRDFARKKKGRPMKNKLADEFYRHIRERVQQLKNATILIKWQNQIKHFHIYGGNHNGCTYFSAFESYTAVRTNTGKIIVTWQM